MGNEGVQPAEALHHGARKRDDSDALIAYCRKHGWIADADFRKAHRYCQ